MRSEEAMMAVTFLLVQTCGTGHSAVHGASELQTLKVQTHVSEMQATPSRGHNRTWKTCSPALHINPHQQETAI